jgi:hypothetical protein
MLPLAHRDLGITARRHIVDAIAAVESLPAEEIPATLANVEVLRAHLWLRLLVPPPVPKSSPPQAKLMTVARSLTLSAFRAGTFTN